MIGQPTAGNQSLGLEHEHFLARKLTTSAGLLYLLLYGPALVVVSSAEEMKVLRLALHLLLTLQ